MVHKSHAIGIKQDISHEALKKTASLLLLGLSASEIKAGLDDFLRTERKKYLKKEGSAETRGFAVQNLMKIWVLPPAELIAFRDDCLALFKDYQDKESALKAINWAMISAVYPFWFNMARQIGRLLNLQELVTQAQIISRIKEQYGDRETVVRCALYVIRSFVNWGVLEDTVAKGCYRKVASLELSAFKMVFVLLESALYLSADGREMLVNLTGNPAFFPFVLPPVSGELLARHCNRVEFFRSGPEDELLQLKSTVALRDSIQL
jgi:hypothetical protein